MEKIQDTKTKDFIFCLPFALNQLGNSFAYT